MPQPTLGTIVRQRRRELGLTQEQLAERVSGEGEYVRQSEISRIENDKVLLPRRERLQRLALALDLPLGELLAHSGWNGAEDHFHRQHEREPVPSVSLQHGTTPDRPAVTLYQLDNSAFVTRRPIASVGILDRDRMTVLHEAVANLRKESARLARNYEIAEELQRKLCSCQVPRSRGDEVEGEGVAG